jgi:enterochelin esterase-like enzyme
VLTILSISNLTARSFTEFVRHLEILSPAQRTASIKKFFSMNHTAPIVEQDSILHFVFYGTAESVGVNGNLQHWIAPDSMTKIECSDSAFFYRTFIAPSNARLDYQLIVDGKYQLDPRNPNHTPSGFGAHSEVRMPKFISSPYLALRTDIPHGTIDSVRPFMVIPSPLRRYLPAARVIKVYKPAGYDTLSNLPSVYIHDGFEAIDFVSVPNIIDNLIAENKIQPIIAVFVPPVDRSGEYYGRMKDRYVKHLSEDLVPLIDHLYKTDPSPLKRAMMGISSGAYFSLYAVLSRPDVFQNVGGQSTTIMQSLIDLTKKQYDLNRIPPLMKIYLDCGRFDIKENDNFNFLEMNRKYSTLLSSLRIPHYFKEVNDGHEWASWRERMPGMLIYFFGRYQ